MSRLGSISGSPPEKLITSIPSATAASIAATIAGDSLRAQPGAVVDEHLVVAEERARRDTGDATLTGRRVRVSGRDARDVRAVTRSSSLKATARWGAVALFGANTRAQ